MLLAAGKGELGPADFQIGQEKLSRGKGGVPDQYRVQITFGTGGDELPMSLDLVQRIVENIETMGDSPWRVDQLHLKRASARDDPDRWSIAHLFSVRYDVPTGTAQPDSAQPGRTLLAEIGRCLADIEVRGARVVPQTIEFHAVQRRRAGSIDQCHVVTVEFDGIGEKFRSAYGRVREAFFDVCEADDGPFESFTEARGEQIIVEPGVVGASYQLRIRTRNREQ
jgi:hypothetical protein